MLSPEIKKLRESLEGKKVDVDKNKLLEELNILDKIDISALYESLSLSSKVCKACGRPLR